MGNIHDMKDDRNIEIEKVGICRYKLPIVFQSREIYNSIADISSTVSLSSDTKGAHLSRIVETLDNKVANRIITLEYFKEVLIELKERLENGNSNLGVKFDIVVPTFTPITKKTSYINSTVEINGIMNGGNYNRSISLTANGAMLCPNSKAISEYGAHSQKCNLKSTLYGDIEKVFIEDIIKIIFGQFSAEVYGIVKSADEKYLTEKAYNNPKFSEDLVRDTLIKLREYYKAGRIETEIENLESIHQHNVYAKGVLR